MKHIRNYESFKSKRNSENINEEFLGKLADWFKGLWKKAVEGLKKLGENPSTGDLRKWVDDNPFNPKSDTFLFKSIIEEFKKKEEANNEDCLTLIDKILDPQSGAMGKEGLQSLYDNLLQAFGKENLAPLETVKFIIETIRNRAIKDYKYAGGPEFKVGDDAKINPDDKKMDLGDSNHLPDYKKVLQGAGEDNKKRKEVAINWIEKTLMTRLDAYASEVTDEQVSEYLKTKNIEAPKGGGDFEVGNTVVYKRDKFNEEDWKKVSDDDKKKTEEGAMKDLQDKEMIGIKKVSKIEGDKISFEDSEFTKERGDILMKVEADKNEEAKKAAESLGKIKDDSEKMKTVADLADMLGDDSKKDQVDQIKKIISGKN
jgi:hypothetical protein